MSNEARASRAAILGMIEVALQDAYEAIRSHPVETVQLFDRGRVAHEKGMAGAEESDWSRDVDLSLGELATIHRYLFTMAFISAYWDVQGDQPRRDKAAQTASLLVAGVGLEPGAVMQRLLKYEEVWRTAIKSEGIGDSPN